MGQTHPNESIEKKNPRNLPTRFALAPFRRKRPVANRMPVSATESYPLSGT
jgi:hypothetical protein